MRIEQVTVPIVRQVIKRPKVAQAVLGRMRWGNVFGESRLRDPYESVPAMLDRGYVTFHRTYQSWFVLGYDEVHKMLRSPKVGVAGRIETLLVVRPYSKLTEQSKTDIGNWLLFVDPPDHTRLRRLVSRTFTPKRIEAMRPRITAVANELLAGAASKVEFDLVSEFAAPLPIFAIGDILGLPRSRWEWLKEISDAIVDLLDPFRGFDAGEIDRNLTELSDYFLDLAERRQAKPEDDLLSALVAVADDGDQLSERELVAMIGFLMLAGHETTTGAIANSIAALGRFPAEQARLRAQPGLIENAIEELLRYDTPVLSDPRVALEDVDVGGKTIPAGGTIVLLLGVANRDTRRFADSDELRLDRVDPRPISFGHGIHHCLGAALARLELQIAIMGFLDRFPAFAVDPDRIVWKPSLTLRRPLSMPVSRVASGHIG